MFVLFVELVDEHLVVVHDETVQLGALNGVIGYAPGRALENLLVTMVRHHAWV